MAMKYLSNNRIVSRSIFFIVPTLAVMVHGNMVRQTSYISPSCDHDGLELHSSVVMTSLEAQSQTECASARMHSPGCKSFNFNTGK